MKKQLLWFCLSILGLGKLTAQDTYELLYLQGNYNQIQELAKRKSTIDDYYWYAISLEKGGNLHRGIPVLEEGIRLYDDNEKLELLLSEFYFETGNYLKAEELLIKYCHHLQSFMQLIQLCEFRNNYKKAIELLKGRVAVDTANIQLIKHIGDNYFQLDSFHIALPDVPESETGYREDQIVISLRKVAEINITLLKEELFFEGELIPSP